MKMEKDWNQEFKFACSFSLDSHSWGNFQHKIPNPNRITVISQNITTTCWIWCRRSSLRSRLKQSWPEETSLNLWGCAVISGTRTWAADPSRMEGLRFGLHEAELVVANKISYLLRTSIRKRCSLRDTRRKRTVCDQESCKQVRHDIWMDVIFIQSEDEGKNVHLV